MPRISPQQHAESEARTDRRAKALVAGLIAAVLCEAVWFAGSSDDPPMEVGGNGNTTSLELILTPTASSTADVTWEADLREIQRIASLAASDDLAEIIHASIDSVLKHLAKHNVSPDSEHGGQVTKMIKDLRRRAGMPHGVRNPSVNERQLARELEREINGCGTRAGENGAGNRTGDRRSQE